MKKSIQTHESYLQAIKQAVIDNASLTAEESMKLISSKLLYGYGKEGVRGMTIYNKWSKDKDSNTDVIEICSCSQESLTQLAGTTIHELAHVLAGNTAGHGKEWKESAKKLGLRNPLQAGQNYLPVSIKPEVRKVWSSLETPKDGKPVPFFINPLSGLVPMRKTGCSIGIGTRGGKSRGTGSGSRLRKYTCDCEIIARVAKDDFKATCNECNTVFKQSIKGV